MKKFKYVFRLIDTDTTISDQNVTSFKFINIGKADVLINNQLLLRAVDLTTVQPNFFEENIFTNEKTAQQYKIVFIRGEVEGQGLIQVIQKIEVQD